MSNVSHFQIFGSLVYYHVYLDSWKKLEPTIEKGTFVGHDETSKAYKVYILSVRETITRSDVKFQEGTTLRMSLEREQETTQEEEKQAPKQEDQ